MSRIFDALQKVVGERAGIDSPPPSESVELLGLAERRVASESETVLKGPIDEGHRPPAAQEPRLRAAESPLPVGGWSPAGLPSPLSDPPEPSTPIPPGPALVGSAEVSPLKVPSGVQRAVAVLRAALPFVERILPLLDGNIVTANSNLLTPHHHAPPAPPPRVDLTLIEDSLTTLKSQYRELRDQVIEQNASLKRIEDQLEMVREATDRNTLEQQELIEDLKGVGNKVNFVALVALGLLAVSVVISIVLYLHILKVCP